MHDEQKSREPERAPELIALERQLRGMSPAAPRIDRDRLMFAAGEAAGAASAAEPGQDGRTMFDETGRPVYIAGPSWAGRRFWPAATVTMTAATLLLAAMLVSQRQALQVASQGAAQLPTTVPVSEQPNVAIAHSPGQLAISTLGSPAFLQSSSGYLGVRYVALRRGVDALEPTFQATTGDRDSSSDKPRTQRNILDELLPSPRRAMNPRS
jgi:hypothetical protein